MKFYILVSDDLNVYNNIAFESSVFHKLEADYLLDKESVAALFLWRNDKTIVLGRNQNIYKECNLEFCRDNNISISRRISGGGAVYHDIGNLNFTFFSSSDIKSLENNYLIIKNALKKFSINAELSGRNDLTINGRKFSGNAFYNTKNCSLHHGTILINSPSSLISKCLTPSELKMKSHSVKSVKSRIINLSEVNNEINCDKLISSIIDSFKYFYETDNVLYNIAVQENILNTNIELFSSYEWIYNTKIESSFDISKHFSWGDIQILLNVKDAKISEVEVYTDSLIPDLPEIIKSCVINLPLKRVVFNSMVKNNCRNFIDSECEKVISDILGLFENILTV